MLPVSTIKQDSFRREIRCFYPQSVQENTLVLTDSTTWRNPYNYKGCVRKTANSKYEQHLEQTGLLTRLNELNHITSIVCECSHNFVVQKKLLRCGAEILRDHLNNHRGYRNIQTPADVNKTQAIFFHLPHDIFYNIIVPYAPVDCYKALVSVNKTTRAKVLSNSDKLVEWVVYGLERFANYSRKVWIRLGADHPRKKLVENYASCFLRYHCDWNRACNQIQEARLCVMHELVERYFNVLVEKGNIVEYCEFLIGIFGARSVLLRGVTWVQGTTKYLVMSLDGLDTNLALLQLFARYGYAYQTQQGPWRFCYYVDDRRIDLVYTHRLHPSVHHELADITADFVA